MAPKRELSPEERAARERTKFLVISRVFDLLTKLAEWVLAAINWKVLLIAAGTYVATVALVPADSRLEIAKGFLRSVIALAEPATWVPFLGWIIAIVLLVVGGVYFYWSEKRVEQSGERVRKLEEDHQPDRLSSREPERLDRYAKERVSTLAPPSGSETRTRVTSEIEHDDGTAEDKRRGEVE